MFERLKFLYRTGKISFEKLDKAISFGWITEAQKAQIIE